MSTRPTKLALLTAIAGLALLAGCGSDDGGGSELSKEDFIGQADSICAAADAQLTATASEMFGEGDEPPPPEEQEAFVRDVVAPSLEQQLGDLEELTPPSEDAEQVDEILTALGELIELAADDPGALLSGEGGAGRRASKLADDYGLVVCGG